MERDAKVLSAVDNLICVLRDETDDNAQNKKLRSIAKRMHTIIMYGSDDDDDKSDDNEETIYDCERHSNDFAVASDVCALVEQYLEKCKHSCDSEEHRRKWKENLSKWIINARNHDNYEYCNQNNLFTRCYFGPYIGADAYCEETASLYCDVLFTYYKQIGCVWQNG